MVFACTVFFWFCFEGAPQPEVYQQTHQVTVFIWCIYILIYNTYDTSEYLYNIGVYNNQAYVYDTPYTYIYPILNKKAKIFRKNAKTTLKHDIELLWIADVSHSIPMCNISLHPSPRSGKSLATAIHEYLARWRLRV